MTLKFVCSRRGACVGKFGSRPSLRRMLSRWSTSSGDWPNKCYKELCNIGLHQTRIPSAHHFSPQALKITVLECRTHFWQYSACSSISCWIVPLILRIVCTTMCHYQPWQQWVSKSPMRSRGCTQCILCWSRANKWNLQSPKKRVKNFDLAPNFWMLLHNQYIFYVKKIWIQLNSTKYPNAQ